MRGKGGAMVASGEGRVGSKVGASQRQFPGGGDPGPDVDGGFGHLTCETVDWTKFGDGWVTKRTGGGAKMCGRVPKGAG